MTRSLLGLAVLLSLVTGVFVGILSEAMLGQRLAFWFGLGAGTLASFASYYHALKKE